MRTLVREGACDPLVAAQARRIVSYRPDLHPLASVFYHVQSMPYRFDADLAADRGFGDDVSEVLQGAPYQAATERLRGPQAVEGDCDCRSVYVQSLLESLGYSTRFAIIRGPGRDDFSHVYSEAQDELGEWVPLDTIMNGKGGRPFFHPGEEVAEPRDKSTITPGLSGGEILLGAAVIWALGRLL